MTNAYHEMYLNKVRAAIADMFDFAIHDFGLDSKDFVQMFTGSDVCRRLENGEPKFLIGMCGEELALRVIEEATGIEPVAEVTERFDRTPEYWCGWAACYYQWLRAIPYGEVFGIASFEEMLALYPTLHEADISKFVDVMDERRELMRCETNLKRIRTAYGCSQSELSRRSGVSLRSIQMYEQRQKDINKSQLATVISLARILGCRAEDLLEA